MQPKCDECPLKGRRQVLGVGPKKPKAIIVGEGPGRQEELKGLPFVGPSGAILMRALEKSGIKRDDAWITNVTLCRPPTSGKDKALVDAVTACRPRLFAELRAIDAPILLLGKYAAQAFLGNEFSITELAGTYHEIQLPEFNHVPKHVIPTIHPARILRGGGEGEGGGNAHSADLLFWNLVYDVAKIAALASGDASVKFVDDIWVETKSPKRADELIRRIAIGAKKAGWIACDTETTVVANCTECNSCPGHVATQARHVEIVAIGFATEAYGVSVAMECISAKTRARIAALLADPTIEKVFHNRTYDMIALAHNRFKVGGKVHCTMLGHHNAFPGAVHRLQTVGTQFYCISPWKSEFRHGKGDVDSLLRYNARDTLVTARVKPKLMRCLERTDNVKSYEIDLQMAEIAERMQEWGIPVDLEVNHQLTGYLEKYTQQRLGGLETQLDNPTTRERFFEYLALEKAKKARKADSDDFYVRQATRRREIEEDFAFNLNAPQQVAALLLACGVPLNGVTKTGQVSTGKSMLQPFLANPVVRGLKDYRAADKLLGTFVRPLPSLVDRDLRLHTVWEPKDITGRWASSPNVQNYSKGTHRKLSYVKWLELPDNEKGMPNMRAQVRAPHGRVLVAMDYKALEGRIVAWLSGDPFLCDVYNKNLDSHSIVAREVFPDFDTMEKNHREKVRDDIKRMFYGGFLYGAKPMNTWKKLLEDGNEVPFPTVSKALAALNKLMPGVGRWHQRLFQQVYKTKEIRSAIFQRRRAFPLGIIEDTVLKNFRVQATAGDIMDIALARFYARKPKHCLMLVNGHDSLVTECAEDHVEEIKALMTDCMVQEHTLDGVTMRFDIDIKVGRSWDVC